MGSRQENDAAWREHEDEQDEIRQELEALEEELAYYDGWDEY